MCTYQGKHFGAHYEDATCIDGYLWDLDSCDEPGGGLHVGGDIPCPACNRAEYVKGIEPPPSGNAHQRRKVYRERAQMVAKWAVC